jgi:hypothetical protein
MKCLPERRHIKSGIVSHTHTHTHTHTYDMWSWFCILMAPFTIVGVCHFQFEAVVLKWQCPVNRPVTCPALYMLSIRNLIILLAERLQMKLFACVSVLEWTTSIPGALSTPSLRWPALQRSRRCYKRVHDSVLTVGQQSHSLRAIPLCPGTHNNSTLFIDWW